MGKRRSGKLSVRTTMLFYLVLPLAGSLALTGYVALTLWERQVEARMISDLEMVARVIQLPLSDAMERDRAEGIEQALESALAIDEVYSAYAYDVQGRPVASAGRRAADVEQEKLTEMAEEGERTGEYGQVGSRRVYSHFVPLSDSRGHATGLLQLTRRERDFRRYIRQIRRHGVLWLGLGVLLMSLLVLGGQNRALGRHFSSLDAGMRRLAAGDREVRLALAGPREIASIAGSFNSMLDSMQAAESELRQQRRQREVMADQLRQAEKLAAIGQLAAGIAHELGTPLSVISGVAQRSLRREEPTAPTARALQKVRSEVARMETIIRQLLDFSHQRRPQRRRLRPELVARAAAAAVTGDYTRRGHALRLSGDERAGMISADPVRLEQALVNLLRNALQAGTNLQVRLSWKADRDGVSFRVEDNGPGIPEKLRARIFEPFFTTKKVGEGTGLGLAVVHGIVKEHGGTVEAGDSALGGALFEIKLPYEPTGETHTS